MTLFDRAEGFESLDDTPRKKQQRKPKHSERHEKDLNKKKTKWKNLVLIICISSFLTITAGFINAVTLFGEYQITTSHMTGTVTKMAIELQARNGVSAARLFGLVCSFIFGAFISGMVIGDYKLKLGRRYGVALLIEAGFLFASWIAIRWIDATFASYLAAAACGLQNAMTTNYSGAIVRTTHVTGIVTDIGIVLGHYVRLRKADFWKLKIFIPILVSYLVGGVCGVFLERLIGDDAMLIAASVIAFIGMFFIVNRWIQNFKEGRQIFATTAKDDNSTHTAIDVLAQDDNLGYSQISMKDDTEEEVQRTMHSMRELDIDAVPVMRSGASNSKLHSTSAVSLGNGNNEGEASTPVTKGRFRVSLPAAFSKRAGDKGKGKSRLLGNQSEMSLSMYSFGGDEDDGDGRADGRADDNEDGAPDDDRSDKGAYAESDNASTVKSVGGDSDYDEENGTR
eukprot:Opistho-2@16382